jgi:hypothetical protein
LDQDPDLTGAALASALEAQFNLSIHKRTAERLIHDLRSKKNDQP